MVNPNAYFDALSIGLRVQKSLNLVGLSEIHLFSYLSCLLWLYKGNPISNWGYGFAITKPAYPFSLELNDAVQALSDMGLITPKEDQYILVTVQGKEEYDTLRTLSQMADREPFLDGACSSLLALPIGTIRDALYKEPNIRGFITLSQSRILFTDNHVDTLYEHFKALSTAVGVDMDDLMVPAVVWLEYLKEVQHIYSREAG